MDSRQSILIVDDEPTNQRIIVETLEDLVEYRLATNGEEALTLAESVQPDLILLDIMMPGIDGLEVCKRIKHDARFEFTKIVLISGKAMLEERLKGYEVGADDYMTKPFSPEELLAKTKVFLRLAKAERELGKKNRALDLTVQEQMKQLTEAELRLMNSEKMSALGEMAGGVAHEINTPLGTILLLLEQIQELMNEHQVDKSTILEFLDKGIKTVDRISKIITGLRTFSREGTTDPMAALPIREVFANTLSLCNEKLKHANIDVHLNEIDIDAQIECRAVQVSQILLNLTNNAYDAISALPEKWIRFEVKQLPSATQIWVTDSGSGVPESVRSKIFQPFFTTKEIGKGTGLGLSISKGIMEAHGGSLSLDEACKNTRFILSFPPAKAGTEPLKKSS